VSAVSSRSERVPARRDRTGDPSAPASSATTNADRITDAERTTNAETTTTTYTITNANTPTTTERR
jgi:hypothetical protein